ncbi:beta-glucan synthesis-associated [Aureobasidium subglaciale]|nr:beta-glucan synthesis-associated [Aureobasidium subglaciale]KAI5225706.1 beta-glucan synthesis-associated [Aureobasidium subglaciale]KAI5229072.1 beta-glucan synthesis-associated [Aureobasidium subglaciale]KAI5263991.1 beta-glucan synthesis-associated [Aureobasidium subglaciale]
MSPPIRPSASRRLTRAETSDAEETRQSEQAGRSASNLHAQLSAAALRPQRPDNQSRGPSRQTSNDDLPRQSPTTTSTLHRSSNSNTSDRSSRDGSVGSLHNIRTRDANAAGIAIGQGLLPPPPIPASRPSPRPYSMRNVSSSTSLSRMATPRSVRDLGRDFDRYYNPFATPAQSTTDLTSLLPRRRSMDSSQYQGGASGPMSRRNSNPFSDEDHPSQRLATPFAASAISTPRNDFIDDNDPDRSFFPYLDDRLGAPGTEDQGYTFPLYWHEKEWDDDMHLPMVDDDVKLKPTLRDRFSRKNVLDTLGLAFMIIGLLSVFIMLPVLSWSGINIIGYNDTPLDQMWGYGDNEPTWATVNASRKWPLLKNMRTGLIDPDTPKTERKRVGVEGDEYQLVFSDEFNDVNRTFYPGDDPYWFAPDFWYGATRDLEWYDPDAVTTWDGALHLQLDAFENHNLRFRSGMLNSWNQLCFKGGIMEVSVSLPGPAGIHALWPGVWSLGNLGRPGYLATTEGTWPYTYNECDAGITPNQSDSSGMNKLPGQKLSSCTCPNADHPSPGVGRGAPEIDVIEVSADYSGLGLGVATQSYQIAPFDTWWYPNADFMEIPDPSLSFLNTWTGGPFQQAVSTTTMLNNKWYDGEEYQKFAFEYVPGSTADSYIAWTVAGQEMMKFDARAIGQNGNIGQRIISEEPMSMILNLGISENWVDINWTAATFPAIMRIDYVRIYHKPGEESITCDPPGFETTEYIKNHPEAYTNPNYTVSTQPSLALAFFPPTPR